MFRTRMLVRLVIPVVVATTVPMLVAGEPAGTTPSLNAPKPPAPSGEKKQ